ncbi:MAG: serine hydrolase [Cyanobacteria bacterium P01_D01_bin.50]
MTISSIILFIATSFLFPSYASASPINTIYVAQVQNSPQSISPEAALERLFTSEDIKAEWFASQFLAQVPIAQVRSLISGIKNQLRTYQEVQKSGNDYLVNFSQGAIRAKIVLNNKGQIAGLLLQPDLKISSLSDAIAEFQKLPGKVSFIVKEDSSILADLNAKTPLAVGSAFKLSVLKTLKEQIASGQKSWSDIIRLQDNKKSLPSGILQSWPDNSPLTLQTLASLMISMSDNTATDIVIKQVGKDKIESNSSPRNRPFLTTRELFTLKSSQNRQLLERYRKSDEKQRRALLAELTNKPLPDVMEFTGNPQALDVEWFYNSEELCQLMEEVQDLPLMSINPGVANPNDWGKIAFKGGSEPGVLNLTTWLKGKNSKQYCVVATWNNNDAPVDELKLAALYSGVISVLAGN